MHDVALRPWHIIELCAGAGGLGLGIELAVPGARGVAYVEREAAAAATLVTRMEAGDLAPAPVWSDLATFDPDPWRGRVHCVASGDPCQPNSVAGKGLGADDERFLIDQVLRVVDGARPLRLFRENVPGNAAGQLAALVGPLEEMGYRVECGIFSSAATGNSHGRKRLVVMADRADCEGWLYPRPWRPGEGSADTRRSGRDLGVPISSTVRSEGFRSDACASGATGGEVRQQWVRSDAREPNYAVVDAIGARWSTAGRRSALDAGAQSLARGGDLADPAILGHQRRRGARGGGADLRTMVVSWPTPAARDWRSDSAQQSDVELYGTKGAPLSRVAVQRYPTSRPALGTHGGPQSLTPIPFSSPPSDGSISGPLLAEISVYRRWSMRSGGAAGWRGTWTRQPRRQLNPKFVELLMRWPIGWSGFGNLETGLIPWLHGMRGAISMLVTARGESERQGALF